MKSLLLTSIFSTFSFLLIAQIGTYDHNRTDINDSPSESRTVLPLLQKAEIQYLTGDVAAAEETYNNAIGQNPLSAEAYISRARYFNRINRLVEAKSDMQKANTINPYIADLFGLNGVGGLLNLTVYHPREALHEISQDDKIEIYSNYLASQLEGDKGDPEMPNMDDFSAVIQKLQVGKYQSALDETDELINNQKHNNPVLYDLRGYLLDELGNPEEAIDAFTLATALDPDFYISWYNLGFAEIETGDFETAKSHLDKAIEINDKFSIAYMKRAFLLDKMGDDEAAIKDYTAVIEIGSYGLTDAYLDRGLLKMVLGDFAGATSDIDRVIRNFPNDKKLRLNRGILNLLYGHPNLAFNDFSIAIDMDIDYGEAYYNRSLARLIRYEHELGCRDLHTSLKLGVDKSEELIKYFCGE